MKVSHIKLVTVEEHHESYYVWRFAMASGWLPKQGNLLLHVDEHHDLWIPSLNRASGSAHTLQEIAAFTYEELGVGNFICPAVYEGIFNSMFWMKYGHGKDLKAKLWSVWAKDTSEKGFLTKTHTDSDSLILPRSAKTLELSSISPDTSKFPTQPFVLDIDLDYFACNTKQRHRLDLEITAPAYEEFISNPYHALRLPSNRTIVEKKNGSFFLVFNPCDPGLSPEIRLEDIDMRIKKLEYYLMTLPFPPALIVICRSVHSGYTPIELACYLEARVKSILGKCFELEFLELKDVMPAGSYLSSIGIHSQP